MKKKRIFGKIIIVLVVIVLIVVCNIIVHYTKICGSYLLEYEVYSYRNGEMRRLFWKYIDVPNLNSSIDERNSLIKEAHDYYDNLY